MSQKTRKLTLSAFLSAMVFVFVYFSSVLPSGQLGIVAFSSLFIASAVIEMGMVAGISVYIASSLLCILILPEKTSALLFTAFFGYYPMLKSAIERIRRLFLQWLIKLIVFNAALSAIWFIFDSFFYALDANRPSFRLVALLGSTIFVLFDYGYTKLIAFYIERISKTIHHKG